MLISAAEHSLFATTDDVEAALPLPASHHLDRIQAVPTSHSYSNPDQVGSPTINHLWQLGNFCAGFPASSSLHTNFVAMSGMKGRLSSCVQMCSYCTPGITRPSSLRGGMLHGPTTVTDTTNAVAYFDRIDPFRCTMCLSLILALVTVTLLSPGCLCLHIHLFTTPAAVPRPSRVTLTRFVCIPLSSFGRGALFILWLTYSIFH